MKTHLWMDSPSNKTMIPAVTLNEVSGQWPFRVFFHYYRKYIQKFTGKSNELLIILITNTHLLLWIISSKGYTYHCIVFSFHMCPCSLSCDLCCFWFLGSCFVQCSCLVIVRFLERFECSWTLTDLFQLPLLIAITMGVTKCSVFSL